MNTLRHSLLFSFLMCCFFTSCKNQSTHSTEVIGSGAIPALAKHGDNIYVVYGKGDSILYSFSSDQGASFSKPELVDTVSKLFSFAMRGPQIAATTNGVCIVACNQNGNIFSYKKSKEGKWQQTAQVNDVDTIAKEGFMALSGDGNNNLFAIWLDLRNNKHNNLYGAKSEDGGQSWSKNTIVYTSPDGHICECCKPSVVVNGHTVNAMFRNWINGNRDLYLIQSFDNGNSFNKAIKLGNESWKLEGCPMDGGGLTVAENGAAQTVWRREGKIFAAEPGQPEKEIGEGKSCTVTSLKGHNVYAWVEQGQIVILKPGGVKQNLGKGQLPVLKATDDNHIICVWQNDKQIQKAIVEI